MNPHPENAKAWQQSEDGRGDFVRHVDTSLDEQIKFADAKAAFIAALASGLLGGLYGARVHEHFTKHSFHDWNFGSWSAIFSFLLLAVAVATSLLSITPRRRRHQPLGYVYWGAIAAHDSQESYYRALRSESGEALIEHLAQHSYVLATICKTKYMWVTIGVYAVFLGAAIGGASILLAEEPAQDSAVQGSRLPSGTMNDKPPYRWGIGEQHSRRAGETAITECARIGCVRSCPRLTA